MPRTPQRIFVRAPNWVGDVVMATASFDRLRAAYPDAHIAVGARPYLRGLFDGTAWFDEFVPTPKAGGPKGLWRAARQLRGGAYDLAVVFPNSPETALGPFLARIPRRLGYRQGRRLWLNEGPTAEGGRRVWQFWKHGPRRVPSPMPLYYQTMLDSLGIPQTGIHPKLVVTPEEEAWLPGWLEERGVRPQDQLALITVGASFGASKLWLPERFAAVGRRLRDERGMVPVILAGPAEVDLARSIAAEVGDRCIHTVDPVLPLANLKPIVRRGALMITGDTGPRHLGVAFDVPTVVLMGPNDPRYTAYCMDHTELLRHAELDCMPCQRPVCPLGTKECMVRITVDEVMAATARLLDR